MPDLHLGWLWGRLDRAATAYLEWRWPAPPEAPAPVVPYAPTSFDQTCVDYIVRDERCGIVLSDTGSGVAYLTNQHHVH